MMMQDDAAKQRILARLRRLEGQVRGVEAMIDQERDCAEILQQLSAIRSAALSASQAFLQDYASGCMQNFDHQSPAEREAALKNLIQLFGKTQA